MKKVAFNKKSFWVIAVVALFMLGSFVSFSKWNQAHYFGRVISVNDASFEIADKKSGTRKILITENTKMEKGRQTVVHLNVGENVIVIAKKGNAGEVEALGVRVVDEKIGRPGN